MHPEVQEFLQSRNRARGGLVEDQRARPGSGPTQLAPRRKSAASAAGRGPRDTAGHHPVGTTPRAWAAGGGGLLRRPAKAQLVFINQLTVSYS